MKSLIAILLLISPLILSAEEVDQATKNKAIKRTCEVFDRLNLIFTKNHLAPLTFIPSELLAFHSQNILRKSDVLELHASSKVSLDFLPDSFELISLYRNDIKYDQGDGYDQPPKPVWTEEQAVATAKEYVEALFKKFPENAGPPKIEFEKRKNLSKNSRTLKYYPGRWNIRWPRVDAQGHLFNHDSIQIYISEDQGLATAFFDFYSNYQEPQGPLISKDEALEIAGPAALALANKWIGPGLELGSRNTVKGIINPNHILQAKSIEDLANCDPNARLAWLVFYHLTANSMPITRTLQIWVDAQTKEVIGGSFN